MIETMRATTLLVLTFAFLSTTNGFTTTSSPIQQRFSQPRLHSSSSTALNVWWFGGTESGEMNQDDDSCELVAVRIERTSPNSRKIAGSISVPTSLDDVWAILSDYDRLSIHVPNLVESRIVSRPSRGEPGDGSYRCKLYQKGAQKIVGFEFGASVTMEMTERVIAASSVDKTSGAPSSPERAIGFKCVDSFFFSEFDGEWRARERVSETGELETELTYVVDVRPKGPVPVAALEWRIREDVPTNLRAVKKAAVEVGSAGVLASRKPRSVRSGLPSQRTTSTRRSVPAAKSNGNRQPQMETNAIRRATVRRPRRSSPLPVRRSQRTQREGALVASQTATLPKTAEPRRSVFQSKAKPAKRTGTRTPLPFKVNWEADETMAAYLSE